MATIEELAKEEYAPEQSQAILELRGLESRMTIALFDSISKVEKVRPRIKGDVYKYNIYIGDKILIVPSNKMNSPAMFSQRYLEEFDKLVPKEIYKNSRWELFVSALKESGKLVTIENNVINQELFDAENFLTEIRRSAKTDNREKYDKKNYVLIEDSKAYVAAQMIKDTFENLKIRTPIERVLELISKYFITRKNVKINSEKVVWSYVFKINLINDATVSLNSDPNFEPKNEEA